MPLHIPEKFFLTAHLPIDGMYVTMQVSVVEQACKLRSMIFEKYKKKKSIGGQSIDDLGKDEDYILKVTGFQDYMYGENQMLSYDCVRKHLSKPDSGLLELTLIPLSDFSENLNEINTSIATSIVDKLLVQEEESERDHSNDQDIFEIKEFYSVNIKTTQRVNLTQEQKGEDCHLFLSAEIFHAGHKLGSSFTLPISSSLNPGWHTKMIFDGLKYSNIPLGSRILFSLYFRRVDTNSTAWVKGICKGDEMLAWVACSIFDQSYRIRDGEFNFRMWTESEASPIGSCYQNLLQLNAPILFVRFEGRPFGKRIYYPIIQDSIESPQLLDDVNEVIIKKLNTIISADPLSPLTDEHKILLWSNRFFLTSMPQALPKFLLSIHWDEPIQVKEAHKLLKIWARPSPLQALELLDAKFADPVVRDFGIECLSYIQDGECYDYLLQLTQVLKHECFHSSSLAIFLLKRAWSNPRIGHSFFWFLKAEMHLEEVGERYTLLLEAYLRGCGLQLRELKKQHEANQAFVRVAEKIKTIPNSQRKAVLLDSLRKLELPDAFQLPLDQRIQVSKLRVEECKYMDSKKLPLWLVLENIEPKRKPISVIFKVGDDLRQDALTLQIIRLFDKVCYYFFMKYFVLFVS